MHLVLILLDRNIDLGTMMRHTWSYQPLLNDVMNMQVNKISVEEVGSSKKKQYDVDPLDFFMQTNANLSFPMVAENADIQLKKYKADYERVSSLSGGAGGTPTEETLGVNTDLLRSAVSAIPELKERKRILDMHMHIASALLQTIKRRSLDTFVALEEAMSKQTKATIIETIADEARGTPDDKVRLALLWVLAQNEENATDANFAELEAALSAANCGINAVNYLKQYAFMTCFFFALMQLIGCAPFCA